MIRDTRKNKTYFDRYLAEQDMRIERFRSKASEKAMNNDEGGAKKAYLFVAGFLKDKIFAAYSAGNPLEEIKVIFRTWVEICQKASTLSYDTLLNMAALAILLKLDEKTSAMVKHLLSEEASDDIILEGFCSYLDGKGFTHNTDTLKFEKNFIGLKKVLDVLDKSAQADCLAAYVKDAWYEAQDDCAWYNSHLNKNEIYVGYWAFECAALAIVLSLDLNKLMDVEFIPVDMLCPQSE